MKFCLHLDIGNIFHKTVQLGLCYPPQPSASADNTNRYHAQPHPIIAYYKISQFLQSL